MSQEDNNNGSLLSLGEESYEDLNNKRKKLEVNSSYISKATSSAQKIKRQNSEERGPEDMFDEQQDPTDDKVGLVRAGSDEDMTAADHKRKIDANKSQNMSETEQERDMESDEEKRALMDREEEDNDQQDQLMQDFKAGGANYKSNMQSYISNFGVSIKVPSMYVIDSKFIGNNHMIQLVKFVISKSEGQIVYTHFLNGKTEKSTLDQIFSEDIYKNGCNCLQLVNCETTTVVKQVVLRVAAKASISLSPDLRFFAILMKKKNNLNIYETNFNFEQLLDRIGEGEEPNYHIKGHKAMKGCKFMKWDASSLYVSVYGYERLAVICLDDGQKSFCKVAKSYFLDQKMYSAMLAVQINCANDQVNVEVACLLINYNIVRIFNIEKKMDEKKAIPFKNKDVSNAKIAISNDFTKVMFSNQDETYILISEENHSYNLINVSWVKQKTVHFIKNIGNSEFLFLASRPYDRSMVLLSSSNSNFKLPIKCKIEPGSLTIYDMYSLNFDAQDEIGIDDLYILSGIDLDVYYNFINVTENKVIFTQVISEIEGFDVTWPYVTFKGFSNFQWVINCNQQNIIHRVEFNSEFTLITCSYITNQLELFLLAEDEDDKIVHILKIDLDRFKDQKNKKEQIFKIEYKFQYTKSGMLENTRIQDFLVRSSSEREAISLNKKLQVYILHDSHLLMWCEGMEELREVLQTTSQKFILINDENFIVEENKEIKGKKYFKLIRVEVDFSLYSLHTIFEQKQDKLNIKAFNYDIVTNSIMLLQNSKGKKKENKQLSIIDLQENQTIFKSIIKKQELIGRLKTARSLFLDGHIYYTDHCIKIRYDLLKDKKGVRELNENEVFDFYDNILVLEEGFKVAIGYPTNTPEANRMIFITRSKKNFSEKEILLLPYLHERKIFLCKTKKECHYFNTTLKKTMYQNQGNVLTQLMSMNITSNKYYIYSLKGILNKRVDFSDLVKKYGTPRTVSNNGTIFIFKKSQSFKLHIIMLTNDGLIHMKTIIVRDAIIEYVEEVQQKLIDSGSSADLKELDQIKSIQEAIQSGNFRELQDKYMCKFDYNINDKMDVAVQIMPLQQIVKQDNRKELKQKMQGIVHSKQAWNMINAVKNSIAAKLREQVGYIIYLQKGTFNINQELVAKYYPELVADFGKDSFEEQDVFMTNHHEEFKYGMKGFSINNSHVYFWNHFNIWSYDINTSDHNFHKLGLIVDPNDKQSWVRRVRTNSSVNEVAIQIRQSKTSENIVVWNIPKDNEVDSFDFDLNPMVFFDSDGHTYITEEDNVVISKQGIRLKCYDVKLVNQHQIERLEKRKNDAFGFHKGYRFDEQGHSWIFLREYISLSFSYMTFVMNLKSQEYNSHEHADYLFDREQYNFIVNKRTFLHDIQLINNPVKLNYILKNFMKIDKILLDQIQYFYTEPNKSGIKKFMKRCTPLHLAFDQQNNRSINILLKFMSLLNYSNFNSFRDLWPYLVDYRGFIDFLNEQTFQTIQMQNKQSIKLAQAQSKEIVTVKPAFRSYVDEIFFKEVMGEDTTQGYNSFPVKIVAIEIGWLLQKEDKAGIKFMAAIANSENLDLCLVPCIQILIEYLYKQYKVVTIKWRLPVYLIYLVLFLVSIYLHNTVESRFEATQPHPVVLLEPSLLSNSSNSTSIETKPEAPYTSANTLDIHEIKQIDQTIKNVGYLNILAVFYSVGYIGFQTVKVGKSYYRSIYAYLDILYTLFNSIIALNMINSYSNYWFNTFGALMAIIIWSKAFYFLQLIDEIAPLIQIIFKIFMDIRYFMVTLVIAIFAFANAFYLIGLNQIQFDKIPIDRNPQYSTMSGSLIYIYMMTRGEVGGIDLYELGDSPSHKLVLWILFILASFVLLVHLLNMLVAIMGNTFAINREVSEQNKMKSKLKFIIDNWWFDAIGEDRNRICYLITALFNEEDDEDVEILKEVHDEVWDAINQRKTATDGIMTELKKVRQKLATVESSLIEKDENQE